jgi:hypothetical protein
MWRIRRIAHIAHMIQPPNFQGRFFFPSPRLGERGLQESLSSRPLTPAPLPGSRGEGSEWAGWSPYFPHLSYFHFLDLIHHCRYIRHNRPNRASG